jgi:Na+-transporting methylmalonyl-CoA/oxaloacetate decarboxylase gamma subunit
MGVVFLLLGLMVGIINAMSRLSALVEGKYARPARAPGATGTPMSDNEIVRVIEAAIRMHRERRGRSV